MIGLPHGDRSGDRGGDEQQRDRARQHTQPPVGVALPLCLSMRVGELLVGEADRRVEVAMFDLVEFFGATRVSPLDGRGQSRTA